ncbi:MAG TPA: ECF transporter S component [Jatrophihabitantaceae bacterium]|jgi:energy-coupling factor transport system substrate-specific component|nr:ECF transporter S component [Jatrophihabitantaceae bacterium]
MNNALILKPRALAAIVAVTLVGIGAFTWPLVLGFSAADAGHAHDAPWIFLIMLPLLLLVVAAEIADGGIDAKAVALLGVLAGACAVLRPITGGVTGVQLMFFLLIPAGRVFGPGFGFVLGNVAMFASAALTGGGGPWLPFQMLAAGWVGLCAGCLPPMRGRAELCLLAGFGLVAGILYGFVLNLWFWPFGTSGTGAGAAVTFVPRAPLVENLHRWLEFSMTTSLGFDIPRGLATAVALLVVGRPVLLALRRAARRAAFDAVPEFAS